jgi:predicted enzyme related to lactoylglutathione lyase
MVQGCRTARTSDGRVRLVSEAQHPKVGAIAWCDLTVPNATEVRDFYRGVVGWETADFDMGGYSDYCMNVPADGKTVAGICHARGLNADLPPQWLLYISVEDLDRSIRRCTELGGRVLAGPKPFCSGGRFCVIQDPAGAVAALCEAPPPRA